VLAKTVNVYPPWFIFLRLRKYWPRHASAVYETKYVIYAGGENKTKVGKKFQLSLKLANFLHRFKE
jgi:hypothetical protein